MPSSYDKYYQTENLFGNPYPELIEFMRSQARGKLLDLGCGQGRDAIPLARMGFEVMGLDNSKVGVEQMNKIATNEGLKLKGIVTDIYSFEDIGEFDYILLDSMFHFAKADKENEAAFIQRIIKESKQNSMTIVCMQDTGKKVAILKETLNQTKQVQLIHEQAFSYTFHDQSTGHQSTSPYLQIACRKI